MGQSDPVETGWPSGRLAGAGSQHPARSNLPSPATMLENTGHLFVSHPQIQPGLRIRCLDYKAGFNAPLSRGPAGASPLPEVSAP